MDQQVSQQIEQQLRTQWQQLYPQILDRFAQVSKADIDAARSADDLVRRIADKSHYSDRFVETQVLELVGVSTGGQPRSAQQQPFGAQSSTQQYSGQHGQN